VAGSHLLTDGFAGYRGGDAGLDEHLKHTPVVQGEEANAGEFFPIIRYRDSFRALFAVLTTSHWPTYPSIILWKLSYVGEIGSPEQHNQTRVLR
jgi:hypothetical protein